MGGVEVREVVDELKRFDEQGVDLCGGKKYATFRETVAEDVVGTFVSRGVQGASDGPARNALGDVGLQVLLQELRRASVESTTLQVSSRSVSLMAGKPHTIMPFLNCVPIASGHVEVHAEPSLLELMMLRSGDGLGVSGDCDMRSSR